MPRDDRGAQLKIAATARTLLGLVLAAVALVALPPAAARPPASGVLVPGRSLGGLGLGATPADVRAAWGSRFGRCRGCSAPTWYFNARPFEPQGAGVEFRRGRAVALFTLSAPPAWRTSRGLRIGDHEARVTTLYGPLPRSECSGYAALVLARGSTLTAVYVADGTVWGFALLLAELPICR